MSRAGRDADSLWVQRVSGPDDAGVWVVSESGPEILLSEEVKTWVQSAGQIFAARSEIASVSMVASSEANRATALGRPPDATALMAEAASLPLCFLNGGVADLIGLEAASDGTHCTSATFQRWIEIATLKGLAHLWLLVDPPSPASPLLRYPPRTMPALPAGAQCRFVPVDLPEAPAGRPAGISVGVDAAWLLSGESGAQVFVVEMLKELVRRPEIARIVMISESGGLPAALHGLPKIAGVSWAAALAREGPLVDILHRPYQPDSDVDYRRYHRVASCVALTVLDMIAYDNAAYHESRWLWRRYQEVFDESICLADCVFAISKYVGSRLERQFAHRLSGPVRSVALGTDHLHPTTQSPRGGGPGLQTLTTGVAGVGEAVKALEQGRFLLVLGNDFEHKNRDFATKVFSEMAARGYDGRLVLAGFHLDLGSSFGHELSGTTHTDRIVRMGAVSAAEKTWLLGRAHAVLYPTSSEGFGLIPFEAAALGTPTAFVRFGPLRETLAGVDACNGWQVGAFTSHVFRLIANPAAQVEQIRAAGAALTWATHVDQILDSYQALLSNGAPWRTRLTPLPGARVRARRALATITDRALRKLRRVAGLK